MPNTTMQFARGEHACHVYRSPSERRDVALPFIHGGLEGGEHCILVTSRDSFGEWREAMDEIGIDVDAEERRNRLHLASGEEWRTPLATSGSLAMARDTIKLLKLLLREFNGVRIVGDGEWHLAPAVSPGTVCHWEATANLVFEHSDVRVICQYSAAHSPADMLHAALRTHASVIWDGQLHPNPHNEARSILRHEPKLNEPVSDRELVDDILRHLGEDDSTQTEI